MGIKNYTKEVESQIESHFEKIANLLRQVTFNVSANEVEDFAYDLLENLKSYRED